MNQDAGPRAPFVIAEMACSHEGDPRLARTIVDAAGRAGANAIQFQIWTPAAIAVPTHKDFPVLQRLEMSPADWRALAEYTRAAYPSMEIIACVYEREAADFATALGVDAFKLHTADLSNPGLVTHVAALGKRVDLSVGASTLDEIADALGWIRANGDAPVWLMYGYQNFPTRVDDVHLRYLATLRDRFQLPVGYQDHTDAEHPAAFWVPAAALGLGVMIQEKHLTHDRSRKGADHQAALNPDEFARFVEMTRAIDRSLGIAAPRPFSPEDLRYRVYSKKSVVAARPLAAGTIVSAADLAFLRANELGMPPAAAGDIIGRRLRRDLAQFALIQQADVE
jgi:N,N'-diacetyllegionaminate synthase